MGVLLVALCLGAALTCSSASAQAVPESRTLSVLLSWGHRSPERTPFYVRLAPEGMDVRPGSESPIGDGVVREEGAWRSRSGAGRTHGIRFTLAYPYREVTPVRDLHITWADLVAQSDADTARRLTEDPAFRRDPRRLTIRMDPEGTKGFTVTLDQLLRNRALWVPSLDVYLAAGEPPVPFEDHLRSLRPWSGRRVLDQVRRQPEATYEDFTARWEDMGHPDYQHPEQPRPGHIVGLSWDSAIPKFGIDRGAGVWSDYGNPDRFRLRFGFADLSQGIGRWWKGQRLEDGLPLVTTALERDGVRYEVEQLACPLEGLPRDRRGDIAMVLLSRLRLTNLHARPTAVPVVLTHERKLPDRQPVLDLRKGAALLRDGQGGPVLLAVEGADGEPALAGVRGYQQELDRADLTLSVALEGRATRELVIKLPSPPVPPEKLPTLLSLSYAAARKETLGFWSGWVARGARFEVPERVVNDLYRASLWHALRLPRRHGGSEERVRIDLPYSNFAYDQTGIPWPINQAVYVDALLYDLRGYHDVSAEELAAAYREDLEPNGHVKGIANWLVYTPGMLYAVARHYLLSGDRAAFERLLPPSLKAMDWCLGQVREAAGQAGPTRGLVLGPLNDLTGDGTWAFSQAYLYAGLDLFGRALRRLGHPRAPEALEAARVLRAAIDRAFHHAAMRSPLVQLRDHTWTPYVPCEATTPSRLTEQWYVADVDTGAMHLVRLGAVPADGDLAEALLNDHEDNLYLKGWGMANEPVYNPQATAYLLRDEPEAAIRAFYSMLTCAFSHSALEPVEHRWTHGQYFGPPSTDGAWFELYRNLLVREVGEETLLLGGATPRRWLEDGRRIEVERAPTEFGPVSFTVESRAGAGEIRARVQVPARSRPKTLLVRLRHPERKRLRAVTLDGRPWTDFDAEKEWIRIEDPQKNTYSLVARY